MPEDEVQRAMEAMPYGMYIVGSAMDGGVNGMMADWVMQVSFDPRLVAVSFEADARTLDNIRAHPRFTVNLLSQDRDSMDLARRFAQPYLGSKVTGRSQGVATAVHHKLENIAYAVTRSGCPVLDAAMAWLECEAEHFVPIGDHILVIGQVLDGRVEREAEPLTSAYTGWTYSG